MSVLTFIPTVRPRMELNLSHQERKILTETLANQHRSLRQQIGRTDYSSAKALLREREQILESVLKKLGAEDLLS
jgi:vacuolar-type H+-ATPase subunit E/Vma4